MKNELTRPLRQFSGFSYSWKELSFEDVVEFYSGLTYKPIDIREDGTLVLRSSNVQNGRVVNADNVYVNPLVVNSNNVQKGDIIVVVRNGSRSLIGKHAQIEHDMDNTVIGAFMTGIRSETPSFINALLDTQKFKDEINKNLGATINQITNGMFKSMSFMFPSMKEQVKIGQYFKHLDDMIEIQQKKIDKTKALKYSYINEMFPSEGMNVPRRRFEDFSEPWKEYRFGDLVTIRRGLTYEPANLSEKGVRVLRSSNINEDTFEFRTDDVFVNEAAINIPEVKENEILITSANGSSRLVGKHALVQNIKTKTVHGGFMLLATSQQPFFINALMNADWYKRFIEVFASGGNGSIGNISKGNLEKQNVYIPCEEEQERIGRFFEHLDNIISTHQLTLNKLKSIKQAYLDDMFV